MSRRNGFSQNPRQVTFGPRKSHRNWQFDRDAARQRGHEARDEMVRVRRRVTALSGLHETARRLVASSQLPDEANKRTSHLDLEQFCRYVDRLLEQLFQLEIRIAQEVRPEALKCDERLNNLAYAVELQDRADHIKSNHSKSEEFKFEFDRTGIVVSVPGATGHFSLDEDGLEACSKVLFLYERDLHRRRVCS